MRRPAPPRALAAALVAALLAGCTGAAPAALEDATGAASAGFSRTSVFPGDYAAQETPRPVREGMFAALPAEVAEVPSALDGATIRIGIVRPDVGEEVRVPVIVVASPYFAPFVASDAEDGELTETVGEELGPLDDWFVPHGYALAAVAVRGSAGSGGCMEYMGEAEQGDVDQAVTWLGTQPWSNGNVGMIGLSYDGATQWMPAARGNPHLKTIVPMSGVSDGFDLFFRNGTPQQRGAWHPAYYWGTSGVLSSATASSTEAVGGNAGCSTVAEAEAAGAQALLTGERNAYWDERNLRPGVEASYQGSIFLVQGLQDWNVVPGHQYPWIHTLEEKGLVVKHLLGQWDHTLPHGAPGAARRVDFPEILLHWWDRWLKEDATVDLGPRVQVQDSEGRWRDEEAWPPRDATPRRLYLAADALQDAPGATETSVIVAASPVHYVPAPGPDERGLQNACAACAVVASAPLEEDLLLSGSVRLQLDVTPLGSNGYVSAYLYTDDGSGARRIGWGSVDLRFAHGGEGPQAVTPGARMPLSLQLEPLDAVVRAGSSVVLVLTQGSYGDARPTTWELPLVAAHPLQVHLGGDAAWLELPTLVRGPEAYFEPPRV